MSRKFASLFVPFDDQYSSTAIWSSGVDFPVEIDADGESRFQMECRGPWNTISKITGLVVSQKFGEAGVPRTPAQSGITVYGVRSMHNPRESGHALEGWVSIGGKKYSAFTSSQLFVVEGRLVDVAILHIRYRAPKPERKTLTRASVTPHGRCERAGCCVEHEINPNVEACR